MDNIDAMFESEFWRACDLEDGKTFTAKISKVEQKELTIPGTSLKKVKPVLTFSNSKKKLALNKTNKDTIKEVLGKNVKAWIGCAITLYQINDAKLGKKLVDALRVKNVRKSDGKKAKPISTNTAATAQQLEAALLELSECNSAAELDKSIEKLRTAQWSKEQGAQIAALIKTVTEKVSNQ